MVDGEKSPVLTAASDRASTQLAKTTIATFFFVQPTADVFKQ